MHGRTIETKPDKKEKAIGRSLIWAGSITGLRGGLKEESKLNEKAPKLGTTA
jgi:hypothetical protein